MKAQVLPEPVLLVAMTDLFYRMAGHTAICTGVGLRIPRRARFLSRYFLSP